MRAGGWLALVSMWLVSCGGGPEAPAPASTAPVSSSVAPVGSTPSPSARPTSPEPPSPTPREAPRSVDDATRACNEGWALFRSGDLDGAAARIEPAAALLAAQPGLSAGTPEAGRVGACLYNLGRVREARSDVEQARDAYTRSLALRPNATVSARLAALPAASDAPAAPPPVDDDETAPLPEDARARALVSAAGGPCAWSWTCQWAISAELVVEGRRWWIVEVRDSEDGDIDWQSPMDSFAVGLAVWIASDTEGPPAWRSELARWRPEIGEVRDVHVDGLHSAEGGLVRADFSLTNTEHCCGGSSVETWTAVAVCSVTSGRCGVAPTAATRDSDAQSPDDPGYVGGHTAWSASATLGSAGLVVRTTSGTRPTFFGWSNALWTEGTHDLAVLR